MLVINVKAAKRRSRFYDPQCARYVTLADLQERQPGGVVFSVIDVETVQDVTRVLDFPFNVACWHETDMIGPVGDVRSWGHNGSRLSGL
jgi:PHB/PHA accumulation regulator DNA-binding domain